MLLLGSLARAASALPAAAAPVVERAGPACLLLLLLQRLASAASATGALEVYLLRDGGARTLLFSKLKEGRAPEREEIEAALNAAARRE